MARKTNCTIKGKEYYRINRKVGMKINDNGVWVNDYKCFYGSCKSEAEKKYHEYMEKLKAGGKAAAESKMCLGEMVDQWIDTIFKSCSLANSTKTTYINAYWNYFRPCPLAGRPIDDVTSLQLQKFYNDSDLTYGALRPIHSILSRFYKYAELNGIGNDITRCVTIPKDEGQLLAASFDVEDVDVWDDKELQKVIAALEGTMRRFLVVLAVNSGLRISELLAVRYDDIRNGILYVTKQVTELEDVQSGIKGVRLKKLKTPSSIRAVPFSASGEYHHRRDITRSLDRLYKRIGVTHHKFHAYRATFGTNLSRAGVPIEETSKLMGHSDISVTAKYYINVDAERKRESVEKISAFSLSASGV